MLAVLALMLLPLSLTTTAASAAVVPGGVGAAGGVVQSPALLHPLTGDLAPLEVPLVRQSRERCGQAALAMVLRFYGADSAGVREAEGAYDPVLRGSLITDLASAAHRAGYDADVATLTPDSLIALLSVGVPAIVLYQSGSGPLTVRHYGVVTGWSATRGSFTLLDGSERPRRMRRDDLAKRWQTAGSQALVVRRLQP